MCGFLLKDSFFALFDLLLCIYICENRHYICIQHLNKDISNIRIKVNVHIYSANSQIYMCKTAVYIKKWRISGGVYHVITITRRKKGHNQAIIQ